MLHRTPTHIHLHQIPVILNFTYLVAWLSPLPTPDPQVHIQKSLGTHPGPRVDVCKVLSLLDNVCVCFCLLTQTAIKGLPEGACTAWILQIKRQLT